MATLAVLTIVSSAIWMVVVQAGSVLPEAQLLPVVLDVTVLARMWLPVPGRLTVTE